MKHGIKQFFNPNPVKEETSSFMKKRKCDNWHPLPFFSLLLLSFTIAHVDAGRITACGPTDQQIPCCGEGKTRPSHCLRYSLTERKKIPECQCALSYQDDLSFCKWNLRMMTLSGYTCEIETENCPAGEQLTKTSLMRCLPGRHYPPKKMSVDELHCDFTGQDNAGSVEASFKNENTQDPDVLFYRLTFNCWLHDCAVRLRIPQESKNSFRKNGTEFRWCYPKGFNGNIPSKTPSEEENKSRNVTYCEKYDLSSTDCVRPPLCNENGKIDRTRYMVPFVEGKVDLTYCEQLCPDEKTTSSEGSTEFGAVKINKKLCFPVPACTGKTPNLKPWNYEIHSITHCVPMCEKDGTAPDIEPEDVSWPFSVSMTECVKLPTCESNGKPPPFGQRNRFNASECAVGGSNDEKDDTTMLIAIIVLAIVAVALIIVAVCLLVGRRLLVKMKLLKPTKNKVCMPPLEARQAIDLKINTFTPCGKTATRSDILEAIFIHFNQQAGKGEKEAPLCAELRTLKNELNGILTKYGGKTGGVGDKYVAKRAEEIKKINAYISSLARTEKLLQENNSVFMRRKEIALTAGPNTQCDVVDRYYCLPEQQLLDLISEAEQRGEKETCAGIIEKAMLTCSLNVTAVQMETVMLETIVHACSKLNLAAPADAVPGAEELDMAKQSIEMQKALLKEQNKAKKK